MNNNKKFNEMFDEAVKKAFKIELSKLLEKYHASIGFEADGDMHGLVNERISVFFHPFDKPIYMATGEEYVLSHRFEVDPSDLK